MYSSIKEKKKVCNLREIAQLEPGQCSDRFWIPEALCMVISSSLRMPPQKRMMGDTRKEGMVSQLIS